MRTAHPQGSHTRNSRPSSRRLWQPSTPPWFPSCQTCAPGTITMASCLWMQAYQAYIPGHVACSPAIMSLKWCKSRVVGQPTTLSDVRYVSPTMSHEYSVLVLMQIMQCHHHESASNYDINEPCLNIGFPKTCDLSYIYHVPLKWQFKILSAIFWDKPTGVKPHGCVSKSSCSAKKNMHMLRHHNVFTQPFDPQSNPINCPSTYEYIPIISPWLIGIVPSLFHYIPLFPHDIPIIGPHSPPHQSSRSGP